jgi:hypothetical protein
VTARARRSRPFSALWLVPVLLVTACSSDGDAAPATSAATTALTSTSSVTVPPATGTTTAAATPEAPSTPVEPPAPPPPPAPTINVMTGLAPTDNVAVAAKIDNTFPGSQWGIGAADIVYVEMVEGDLSRLMAVFHTTFPGEVGPVRSVRTTDPDVLTAFGRPALMFSGGAGGPLDNFASAGLVDASPDVIGGAYWRSSAASEPYNLHADVLKVASQLGGIGRPTSPGFVFSDDLGGYAGQRDVDRVSAAFANPLSFRWSNGVWNYIRRGAVQTDGATSEAFAFQNLLVQRTTAQPDGTVDVNGIPSFKSNSTGSGTFTLYRDGKAVDGTWSRPDAMSPTSYLDGAGNPVPFRTGKTWVVLAPGQIPTSEG